MFHATDPHMAPTSRSHNAQQQQSPFACNVVHTLMKKNKRPSKFSAKKASLISLVRLIPFPIFTEFFRITLILAPGKRKSTILDFLPCYVMDWTHTSNVLGLLMERRVQGGKKDISMTARGDLESFNLNIKREMTLFWIPTWWSRTYRLYV